MEQRRTVAEAMGPVWEANHVWLIFMITGLFTAFPIAFGVLGLALYAPFTIALIGIGLGKLPYENVDLKRYYPYGNPAFPA